MDKRVRFLLILLIMALFLASFIALAFSLWPFPSVYESIQLSPGASP
jgi:hypothetical protein